MNFLDRVWPTLPMWRKVLYIGLGKYTPRKERGSLKRYHAVPKVDMPKFAAPHLASLCSLQLQDLRRLPGPFIALLHEDCQFTQLSPTRANFGALLTSAFELGSLQKANCTFGWS